MQNKKESFLFIKNKNHTPFSKKNKNKKMKKLVIGCDHAGFPYKDAIIDFVKEKGYLIEDKGTFSLESVDYPDFAHQVAQSIVNKNADLGILLCGSGNGVSITANKYAAVRAALCWEVELAVLARQHNDANILSIPVRFVTLEKALHMLEAFLNTDFEGGRHQNRVNKINACSIN